MFKQAWNWFIRKNLEDAAAEIERKFKENVKNHQKEIKQLEEIRRRVIWICQDVNLLKQNIKKLVKGGKNAK